jgi:hypothetical protein
VARIVLYNDNIVDAKHLKGSDDAHVSMLHSRYAGVAFGSCQSHMHVATYDFSVVDIAIAITITNRHFNSGESKAVI